MDDLESLEETPDVMDDPGLMADLREALSENSTTAAIRLTRAEAYVSALLRHGGSGER